MSELNYS